MKAHFKRVHEKKEEVKKEIVAKYQCKRINCQERLRTKTALKAHTTMHELEDAQKQTDRDVLTT